MFAAVAEQFTVPLQAAASIPARTEYLYDLLVVPRLGVCACRIVFVNTPTI